MMPLALVIGCSTPGPGAAPGPKPLVVPPPTPPAQRVQKNCKEALGVCEYRVLPDLAVAKAGKPSMLCSVIVTGSGFAKATLGFQQWGTEVKLRGCAGLSLALDDGPPLPSRVHEYHSGLGKGFVVEAVTIPLSVAELKQVAAASSVDYTLCGVDGRLPAAELALLGRLLKRWNPR